MRLSAQAQQARLHRLGKRLVALSRSRSQVGQLVAEALLELPWSLLRKPVPARNGGAQDATAEPAPSDHGHASKQPRRLASIASFEKRPHMRGAGCALGVHDALSGVALDAGGKASHSPEVPGQAKPKPAKATKALVSATRSAPSICLSWRLGHTQLTPMLGPALCALPGAWSLKMHHSPRFRDRHRMGVFGPCGRGTSLRLDLE